MSPTPRVINLDRIRGRASYRLFKEAAGMLAYPTDREGILRWIYNLLDTKHCFGSQLNAGRAKEALELVLRERKGWGGLQRCPECDGTLEWEDTRWADFDEWELTEKCWKCGRTFCTSFLAVQWQEVRA